MTRSPSRLTKGRRAAYTAAMIGVPVLFFVLLEIGLRLAGVGEDLPLFVPIEHAPEWRMQNPRVARRYFSRQASVPTGLNDAFHATKDSTAYRIVVQGGSSAAGYPYYFGGAFSRMLQQRLQQTFPNRRIEVVNTALAAVNSYTLLDFADEILEESPDAVLIYAGHNEYYGALGVGSTESIGRSRTVVNLYLRLQRFRTVQALRSVLAWFASVGSGRADGPPGRTLMERMVGEQRIPVYSPLFDAGLDQFKGNLRALLDRYRRAGVPVYIATIASNERDHPPFVSGPRPGTDEDAWRTALARIATLIRTGRRDAALAGLDSLDRIDSTDAQVHYVRARLLDGSADPAEVRREYRTARDLDQLRFRAPDTVNAIIRDEAARAGAQVVDVEGALRAASPDGIIDGTLMLEHLHPNLEGYFLMANAFYEALEDDGRIGGWNYRVSRETARRERLVTAVDSIYGAFRLRQLLGSWPFRPPGTFDRSLDTLTATDPYEALALRLHRGEIGWFEATEQVARLRSESGDYQKALRAALAMIQQYPYLALPYALAGDVLVRQGRLREALAYYGAASDIDDSAGIRAAIGDVWMLSRRPRMAIPSYERALRIDSSDSDIHLKLARAHVVAGDTTTAVETLQELLRRNPGEERAARMLRGLEGTRP